MDAHQQNTINRTSAKIHHVHDLVLFGIAYISKNAVDMTLTLAQIRLNFSSDKVEDSQSFVVPGATHIL
jgi:hypothetical protein